MIATANHKPPATPPTARRTPAAEYVRMSTDDQADSPEQQREVIGKLAVRESLGIVARFSDEGITGDSGIETRPGLAAMLQAAARREFQVLLVQDLSRLTRQDSVDAGHIASVLKRAGVRVVTMTDGTFDLRQPMDRLRFAFSGEGNNGENVKRAYLITRGKLAAAKRGTWNGGEAPFGMDRGLFSLDGVLLRRLGPQQRPDQPKAQAVRLVPSLDADKLAAVRYAFRRFGTADISRGKLAREMNRKGFASPEGKGWTRQNLTALLQRPCYCGTARWGATAGGTYYQTAGDEIQAVAPGGDGPKRVTTKAAQDAIHVAKAHEGIIEPDLFARVQVKLLRNPGAQPGGRRRPDAYLLGGLLFCGHCGAPLRGHTRRGKDRRGDPTYVCGTHDRYGSDPVRNPRGCGYQSVDARAVMAWIVDAARKMLLAVDRDELVERFRAKLAGRVKSKTTDTARLEKRAADLDVQVGRLVKAIRSTDCPELADELQAVRRERDQVKAELHQAAGHDGHGDVVAQAARLADEAWGLAEALADADPAVTREALRLTVSKIECRWTREQKPGGAYWHRLAEGKVFLRENGLLANLSAAGGAL